MNNLPHFGPQPWYQPDGSFIDYAGTRYPRNYIEKLRLTVANLPINLMEGFKEKVTGVLEAKGQNLLIVEGETGSGKTTQVPKVVFDHLKLRTPMVVTEPRVVAAMQAARRLSEELTLETGNLDYALGSLIGYRTSKERSGNGGTRALYVTEWLQLVRQTISQLIPGVLIMDEVHEHHIETEFLLKFCKEYLAKKPRDFKLIIMSATLDNNSIAEFFEPVCDDIVTLKVPGRTYPVNKIIVPGNQFVSQIVAAAKDQKHVMVFVEGKKQIEKTMTALSSQLPSDKYEVMPFHSEISLSDRQQIFEQPTNGKTKIIIATNIGESSLTIDYLDTIVSNGIRKVPMVDGRGVEGIYPETISVANFYQQAGRVGRTHPGEYVLANTEFYHTFADAPIDDLKNFPQREIDIYPSPDIERLSLEKHVLLAIASGHDPKKAMRQAIAKAKKSRELGVGEKADSVFWHQPNETLMNRTYKNLSLLGAIDGNNNITNIGLEILRYPLDPFVSRILCEAIRRDCVEEVVPMCAIINERGFLGKSEGWKNLRLKSDRSSDLFGHAKLLQTITATKLEPDILNKFIALAELKKDRINLFKSLSANENGTKNNQMLFEVVDLSAIGIKEKKVYDILKTIDTIKSRLASSEEETKKALQAGTKSTKNKSRDILLSIASGLGTRLFTWEKQENGFVSQMIPWEVFTKANTSLVQQGAGSSFIGLPYIIENEDDSETCILQFISRLSAEDTSEIFHAHIRREYSDVTFGNFTAKKDPHGRYTKEIEEQLKPSKKPKRYKRKAISAKVLAHVLEDYQGCALQDAVQELEERDIEVVLTTVWLPDFLVQNNLKILKWIREKEQKPKGMAYQKAKYRNMGNKEIDKEKFKEVLALITGRMWSLFNLANPNQTEHNFIHNSIIFESFINSNDRRIRRFLENPYI